MLPISSHTRPSPVVVTLRRALGLVALAGLTLVVFGSVGGPAHARAVDRGAGHAGGGVVAAREADLRPNADVDSTCDPDRLGQQEEAFKRAEQAFTAAPSPRTEATYRESARLYLAHANRCARNMVGAADAPDAGHDHGGRTDAAQGGDQSDNPTFDPLIRFDNVGMIWDESLGRMVPDPLLTERANNRDQNADSPDAPLWDLVGTKWGVPSPFTGGTFAPGPRNPGGTVTYSFIDDGVAMEGGNPSIAISSMTNFQPCFYDEIRNAFKLWQAVADIQFVEVADNNVAHNGAGAVGDIRITAHTGAELSGGVLAFGYFPPPNGVSAAGDIHFNDAFNWTCDHRVQGQFDIGIVATHEIGHAIGLDHETTVPAIMEPFYNPTINDQNQFFAANLTIPRLNPDDVSGAQEIYSAAEADLAIAKAAIPDPVRAGRELIYRLTVLNRGPETASGVTVVDDLPLDLQFIEVTGQGLNQFSCNTSFGTGPNGEDQLTCLLDDLAVGATRTFEIKMRVPADYVADEEDGTDVIENRAVVDGYADDPDRANNTATTRTLVEEWADLTILKLSKPDDAVRAGEEFEYTIFVENLGPSAARGVKIRDNILASRRFDVEDVIEDPNRDDECSPLSSNNVPAEEIVCELNEPLEPVGDPGGGTGRWVIKIRVKGHETQDIDNIVRVFTGPGHWDEEGVLWDSGTPDPNADNNQAIDEISVLDTADLELGKGDDDDPVLAGENIEYTINVKNNGPSTAENVVIWDRLPAGVEVVTIFGRDADDDPVGCNAGTPGDPFDPARCAIGTLKPGESGRMRIEVRTDPGLVTDVVTDKKIVFNDAWVTSDIFDPDTSDNHDTEYTEVRAEADIDLEKSLLGPVNPLVGTNITYLIEVENEGPSVSRDVSIIDRLPPEVEYVHAYVDWESALGGVPLPCEVDTANVVTCPLGDIRPTNGVPVKVFITVRIKPNTPDSAIITNRVRFVSDTPDTHNSHDSDTLNTEVKTRADVSIMKTSEPEKVFAGEQKRYKIWVTNHGPSDALDVKVYDLLPDEVDYEIDTNAPMCTRPANLRGFRAVLNTDNEIPNPSGPDTAMGLATFILDVDTNLLRYSIQVADMTSAITAAHIHLGATGQTGMVALGLYGGPPPVFDETHPLVGSVTITDVLETMLLTNPAGLYVNVHTATNPAGEIRGQVAAARNRPLECNLGTLAPSGPPPPPTGSGPTPAPVTYPDSRHFEIWVRVRPDTLAGTTITNVAMVESTTTLGDPDLSNNVSSSKNLVLNKADLKITKFGKMDDEVRAGDVLTYTVIVDNLGPSVATGVAIKDVLQSSGRFDLIDIATDRDAKCERTPPGGGPIAILASPWPPATALPALGSVIAPTGVANIDQRLQTDCTLDNPLGVLQAGPGVPNPGRWILTMRVRARQTQDINNIAAVLSQAEDPNKDNNMAMVEHAITDVADVGVTKTAVGEVQVDGVAGLIFNVNTPGPFPFAPNYSSMANMVTAGRRVRYTITVTNNGPSDADNAIVTDRLPPGVTIVPGSLTVSIVNGTQTTGTCATGTPGEPLDRFTCGLGDLRSVPVGVATIVFDALVAPNVPDGTVLENDVCVGSDIFDNNNANNCAHNQTIVKTSADMAIAKTSVGSNKVGYNATLRKFQFQDIVGQVTAGGQLRYEITVQNDGPSDSLNVTVKDTLPQPFAIPGSPPNLNPVTYLRADGADCRPDEQNQNILFCSLGTMAAGSRKTFDIYVLVDPAVPNATVLTNRVDLLEAPTSPPNQPGPVPPTPPEPTLPLTQDPNEANDFATTNTTVLAVADVFIEKVDIPAEPRLDKPFEPDEAIAGKEHRYKITFGNHGWSVARGVGVTDLLDFKQTGRLGETFLRCEPIDPDDRVTCAFTAPNVVTVTSFLSGNNAVIPTAGNGTLMVDDEFSFYLITMVDPGYVLDADNTGTSPGVGIPKGTLAVNEARITTTTTDFNLLNNMDRHLTRIIAEADLMITKVDDAAGFLRCDPVAPGGMITYTLEVKNIGMSDAAQVWVVDQLPLNGVVLDPAQVTVTVSRGRVITVRDDGFIEIVVGDDPNNNGVNQLGRLNADSPPVIITIGVMVQRMAECGALLRNEARVETRRNTIINQTLTITGLVAGDQLVAIDFRPATGELFGISTTSRVYRIDKTTGAATLVGGPFAPALSGSSFGMDFNPTVDAIRVISDLDQNLRVSPVTGLVLGTDLTLAYAAGDPGAGSNPEAVGAAYTNNFAGATTTTLFDIDATRDTLVRQDPPNNGTLNTIGALGLNVTNLVGFDVAQSSGIAYAALQPVGSTNSNLYRINLLSGQATFLGSFGTNQLVRGLAVMAGQGDTMFALTTGNSLLALSSSAPTPDPDLSNNTEAEETRIECPSVEVKKTVSFNGQCPGIDLPRVWNQVAQPVTFCFEITNTGTTFLDTIRITDTLKSRTRMPMPIFTDTITFGKDPKMPVAPGETVKRQTTIDHLLLMWDCGVVTDVVEVSANPVNSGRTDFPCLPIVRDDDTAIIDVPCAGVDFRLQLPVIGGENCKTWVQVQNVGDLDTKALFVVWGEPGACPPQAAGPLKVECTGLLRPGAAWSFADGWQLPAGAHSAVVYSLNAVNRVPDDRGRRVPFADLACIELFRYIVGDYGEWWRFDLAYREQDMYASRRTPAGERIELDFGQNPGEPLAISVNRSCPDPVDPNLTNHAAYTGISSDMEGARDPKSGAYMYYAPLIFANKGGLNSWMYIQNSGDECTSLEIWFKGQDNCLRPIIGDVLTLSPGETVHFDPNKVVGPDWLGSAWIRATQPLGIVIDTMGPNHFTSYLGLPADLDDLHFSYGDEVNYAPLIYSEYQGWDTAIQVQNLSGTTAAKVKVYFLDRSGDVITTVVDWICPRGSQTFFLPVIANLPGDWVGHARIESQVWWTPGTKPVDPPRVNSVVLMERWIDAARTQRREAVAYNAQGECLLYDWQVGAGKGGLQSGSAVFAIPLVAKGYNGINSEIGITNLVAKPGFTDFVIYLYDQNGLLDHICEKLHDQQVEYINLATWGAIPQRFLGSMVVSATFWEHDVFDPNGGFLRNLVGLGGVSVERIGGILGAPDVPGDESKAFEAMPVYDHFIIEDDPGCPGVPPFRPGR